MSVAFLHVHWLWNGVSGRHPRSGFKSRSWAQRLHSGQTSIYHQTVQDNSYAWRVWSGGTFALSRFCVCVRVCVTMSASAMIENKMHESRNTSKMVERGWSMAISASLDPFRSPCGIGRSHAVNFRPEHSGLRCFCECVNTYKTQCPFVIIQLSSFCCGADLMSLFRWLR